MDMFMPSEVARLVLGYLKELGCTRTIQVYLKENTHLTEYVSCLRKGTEYPTTIGGKSLVDLLQELCNLKATGRSSSDDMKQLFDRLESGIAHLKCIYTNGHVKTDCLAAPVVSNLSLSQAQLAARVRHKTAMQEQQRYASHLNDCSLSSDESSSVEVDSSVLDICTVDDPSVHGGVTEIDDKFHHSKTVNRLAVQVTKEGGCGSSGKVPSDVLVNSSLCSASNCLFTPVSKSFEVLSSPSSIARSALIFSFGIDALQTPQKDKCIVAEDGSWRSPRRKSQLPRKRLTYSPSTAKQKQTVAAAEDSEIQTEESVDVSGLIGKLINNTALHERIADNINKAVRNTSQTNTADVSTSSNEESVTEPASEKVKESLRQSPDPLSPAPVVLSSQERFQQHMPDSIIKDIVDRTESDPLFEAFLNIFFDKTDGNSHDSEHVGVSDCHAESPDTHGTPISIVCRTSPPETNVSSLRTTPRSCVSTEFPRSIEGQNCVLTPEHHEEIVTEVQHSSSSQRPSSASMCSGKSPSSDICESGSSSCYVNSSPTLSTTEGKTKPPQSSSNTDSSQSSLVFISTETQQRNSSPDLLQQVMSCGLQLDSCESVTSEVENNELTVTYTMVEAVHEEGSQIVLYPDVQSSLNTIIVDAIPQLSASNVQYIMLSPGQLSALGGQQNTTVSSSTLSRGHLSRDLTLANVVTPGAVFEELSREPKALRPVQSQRQIRRKLSTVSCDSLTDDARSSFAARDASRLRTASPDISGRRANVSILKQVSKKQEQIEHSKNATAEPTVDSGRKSVIQWSSPNAEDSRSTPTKSPVSLNHSPSIKNSQLTRLLDSAKVIRRNSGSSTKRYYVRTLDFGSSVTDRTKRSSFQDKNVDIPLNIPTSRESGDGGNEQMQIPLSSALAKNQLAVKIDKSTLKDDGSSSKNVTLIKRKTKSKQRRSKDETLQRLDGNTKRKRTDSNESVLSDMDVDQFLSRLQYVE